MLQVCSVWLQALLSQVVAFCDRGISASATSRSAQEGTVSLDHFWLILTSILLVALWFIYIKKPGDTHVGHIVVVVKEVLKKQGISDSDIKTYIASAAFIKDLKASNLRLSDEVSAARILVNFNEALALKTARALKAKAL